MGRWRGLWREFWCWGAGSAQGCWESVPCSGWFRWVSRVGCAFGVGFWQPWGCAAGCLATAISGEWLVAIFDAIDTMTASDWLLPFRFNLAGNASLSVRPVLVDDAAPAWRGLVCVLPRP